MGQYHKVFNLDKKEYIVPHKLGAGLKLWEQIANHPSTGEALIILLAASNGRGGGDLMSAPIVGHWAGDRIAVIGDYAEDSDLPEEFHAGEIYGSNEYRDVTDEVCAVLEHELNIKFTGFGWRDVVAE